MVPRGGATRALPKGDDRATKGRVFGVDRPASWRTFLWAGSRMRCFGAEPTRGARTNPPGSGELGHVAVGKPTRVARSRSRARHQRAGKCRGPAGWSGTSQHTCIATSVLTASPSPIVSTHSYCMVGHVAKLTVELFFSVRIFCMRNVKNSFFHTKRGGRSVHTRGT